MLAELGLGWSPSLLAMSASDQILGLIVAPLVVEEVLVLGGMWWCAPGDVVSGDGWRMSLLWGDEVMNAG